MQKMRVRSLGSILLPWRRARQLTPAFLPGESQEQRSLMGYSHGAADTTAATEHACTTSLVISEMQINITVRLSWQRIWLHCGRPGFYPWVRKVPWRRERLPTPVFWPGEFHGLYSPQGHKESDITEQRSLSHFTYTR